MLFNLYGDVRRKMTRDFRAYGANVLLGPASADPERLGGVIPEDTLGRLDSIRKDSQGLAAAPVLYSVVRLASLARAARAPEFQNAVAVGTDFPALRRLFPSWRVDGSSEGDAGALDPGTCAIGAHIASQLRVGIGNQLEIEPARDAPKSYELGRRQFRIAYVVTTGASEDDQVFIRLGSLQRLSGLEGEISLIELSVTGDSAKIERVVRGLGQAFPNLSVRPIRQILYSEVRILGTIRALMTWLTALILTIIALCVAATMTAIVLERRRDIAVMKALGSSDRTVFRLFLGEAAGLGFIGGVTGFVLGEWVARYLAGRLFGVSLRIVWWTFPLVCLLSVVVAVLATSFPVRIARRIEPAVVLKGE
jgi:putative ABC transport system permease protein